MDPIMGSADGERRLAQHLREALQQHYTALPETGRQPAGAGSGPQGFRRAMACLPTGVSVLTTPSASALWGMTVGSLTSLSLEPALLLVCLRRQSTALDLLVEHACFALSVLAVGQEAIADAFSRPRDPGPPDAVEPAVFEGLPVIEGALAWFSCRLHDSFRSGDHVIIVGRVQHVRSRPGEPLVRHASQYRRLQQVEK